MNSEDKNIIINNINLISKFTNTDKFKKLKEESYDKYKLELEKLFPSFSKKYNNLFKKIINNEDIELLNNIFSIMDNIKNNNLDEENGMKMFDEILAKKYLYPKLGKPKKKI